MCEITKNNFEELLPDIEYNLNKSTFIAIDCEFSGLKSDANIKNSLFDSPEDRYIKLKNSLNQFISLQFGLSAFHYNRDLKQYEASVYKFHIFPRSFGDEIDPKFLSQASSFEFLAKFNFDFNKVLYEGLSYLNIEQQNMLRQKLENGTFADYVYSTLDIDEQRQLHEISNSFALWLKSAQEKDIYSYTLHQNNERFVFSLKLELKKKFNNVWCFTDGSVIKLKLMSPSEKQNLENEVDHLDSQLFRYYCGFSNVFNILTQIKKPIIGHNILLDLFIVFNQFHKPLPNSLKIFKRDISEIFPIIFDTKYITNELQKTLDQNDRLNDTSLSSLYNFVTDRCTYIAPYAPKIELKTNFKDVEAQKVHDAGWDSYITGFSFIRLCHIIASKKNNVCRPFTSPEHLNAVEHLKNRVNLARASVTFIDLVNKDVIRDSRPPLLYISCRRKKQKIDINNLTQVFAKYGGFDVKPINNYSALLAVATYGSANDILKDFFKNNELRVERYTFFRHSQAFRYCLWAGIVVPLFGLGIVLAVKTPEKSSP